MPFSGGANVNAVNKDGDTALHLAALENSKEIAADLLQRGADVNVLNKDGDTALHWAARANSKEIAAELLQRGAIVSVVNKDGDTALHLAALNNSKEIAAELLQRGAGVNVVNKDGDTALHIAARADSKEIAADLLQRAADVNVVNKNGDTVLHLAALMNSKEIAVDLLQRGADVNALDKKGNTALHLAALRNNIEIAANLIQCCDDVNVVTNNGTTALHLAALAHSKEIVADLLQSGAEVNVVNKDGNTALVMAALANSKEIVANLLESGADVSAVNKDGTTALHLAAKGNSKEIVADLLRSGAEVNALDKNRNTALHLAAAENMKEIAAELLDHGANFTVLNTLSKTSIEIASENADTDIFVCACQKFPLALSLMNARGETAMHMSARNCITEVIQLLAIVNDTQSSSAHQVGSTNLPDYSAELLANLRDINGNTPLFHWSMVCEKTLPQRVKNHPINVSEYGRNLIGISALVNVRNNQDQTPLHLASCWETVDVLLENGAQPNVTDMFNGDTPLITRVKSLGRSSHQVYEEISTQGSRDFEIHVACVQEWEKIIDRELDPWTANNKNETVLGLLIQNEQYLLAGALISVLKNKGLVDRRHTNGETILHLTCASDAYELQGTIDDLLKSHVKVNAHNAEKETPLHLVCRKLAAIGNGGQEDLSGTMHYWTAGRLLAYGANPRMLDVQGVSCFDICRSIPQLLDLLNQPVDVSAIPPLLKWSDPKSLKHRSKIAQVVRNQKSNRIEWFHYYEESIASGSFGHVFVGVDERNGREVAVKRIEKQRLLGSEDQREITNLVKLRDCEEIVKYIGHYEDTHFVYLILDLMEGTLDEYLDTDKRDKSLDVTLCRDVVNGLKYLHRNNVLHRDIKPGNILYKNSPRICLKLADFGLSTKAVFSTTLQTVSVMHATAGTRCWMAPELLKATKEIKHSEASDAFACGLVLHYLLADKKHPFTEPSTTIKSGIVVQNETEHNIMDYKPFIHSRLSPEACDFLAKLLLEDKSKRPKLHDVLSHPLFWTKMKMARLLEAVGNQPEIEKPRHKARGTLSPLELHLENTLGKDFMVNPWDNSIVQVYVEMTSSGRRRYDTTSAVDLVRFVRNSHAHVSASTRTAPVKDLLMKDFVFFDKFPSLLIEVYRAVMLHGWDKRTEIEAVLTDEKSQ